jgi:cell division protein FtsX
VAFSGWIALTSKEMVLNIKQNIEVQVYLDKSLSQIQKDSVRNLIAKKSYVSYSDNVPQIKFISKESTAEKVLKDIKEDAKKQKIQLTYIKDGKRKNKTKKELEDEINKKVKPSTKVETKEDMKKEIQREIKAGIQAPKQYRRSYVV